MADDIAMKRSRFRQWFMAAAFVAACLAVGGVSGHFAGAHAELTAALGLAVYFARPYHACERGLNENTNGLVRQFFPKGLDLAAVTDGQVRRVERLLNTRPRKSLGYRMPLEVLSGLSSP